jgi:hypothetical protein
MRETGCMTTQEALLLKSATTKVNANAFTYASG